MKKLLLIVLMVLSLQLFSEDYKVVLKKGVTLSQQEINKNNKEIEVAFKRDYRLITEATFEGVKTMVSGMMESQMDLPAMDKRTSLKFKKKTEEYTIGLFDDLLKKYNMQEKVFGKISRSDFFSWNILLAKYGLEIRQRRVKYLEKLNQVFSEVYHSIVDNSDFVSLKLELFGGEISEAEYFNRLEAELDRDLVLGYTGFGIHRDDFIFLFNGKEADGTASRGELRSMILAMKFIEAELIFQETGKKPVVLLDDVFSELDNMRQKSLVKNFKENQVIITSVEEI